MGLFKPKEEKQFEKEYSQESTELFVLTKDACIMIPTGSSNLFISNLAAVYNPKTNCLKTENSVLNWYDSKNKYKLDYQSADDILVLKKNSEPLFLPYTIYKVRVKEQKEGFSKNRYDKSTRYLLEEILEEKTVHKELDQLREKILTKVIISKPYSTLVLDRHKSENYEGEITFFGSKCSVQVAPDDDYSSDASYSLSLLESLLERESTVKQKIITALKSKLNQMIETNYYAEHNLERITDDDIENISLRRIVIDKQIELYYKDIFLNSLDIVITLNQNLEPTHTEVPGEYEDF